jgi:hypothetical protein
MKHWIFTWKSIRIYDRIKMVASFDSLCFEILALHRWYQPSLPTHGYMNIIEEYHGLLQTNQTETKTTKMIPKNVGPEVLPVILCLALIPMNSLSSVRPRSWPRWSILSVDQSSSLSVSTSPSSLTNFFVYVYTANRRYGVQLAILTYPSILVVCTDPKPTIVKGPLVPIKEKAIN